jgi:predicted TIM-barrel fold metal-dependent hydrolase
MTLDFDLADAHQHFWDPRANYHPWLRDEPPIAFRYGDYSALKRPYLPPDYLAEAAPNRVARTVYIETEWDPADPCGEMAYVETMRRQFGLPSVAIAQAWLDRADCAAVLESHAARPFVRGIRHKPRANSTPADAAPGGMADAAWRRGYACLGELGLHFELQTPWWHLHEACRLALDFPHIPIVLNHTGLPADRSVEGIAGWKRAMRALAQCPNVTVKISGLGQAGAPWNTAANRDIVLTTIALFGTDRAMFASNFPVDSLCGSFATIFGGFDEITRDFSDAQRRALFHDNAVRHYRMDAISAPARPPEGGTALSKAPPSGKMSRSDGRDLQ